MPTRTSKTDPLGRQTLQRCWWIGWRRTVSSAVEQLNALAESPAGELWLPNDRCANPIGAPCCFCHSPGGIGVSKVSRRVVLVAIAGSALVAGWCARSRVVWRDASYVELIRQFQDSRPLEAQIPKGASTRRWHEVLAVSDGVKATVDVASGLSPRATVTFSDDDSVYELYPREDYTTVLAVKADGTGVLILRSVALFAKAQRLSRFDLAARKVTADRRVDLGDGDAR